jgi:hypothetical protein
MECGLAAMAAYKRVTRTGQTALPASVLAE